MNALEKALLIKELHQLLDGLEHRSLSFFETAKSKSRLTEIFRLCDEPIFKKQILKFKSQTQPEQAATDFADYTLFKLSYRGLFRQQGTLNRRYTKILSQVGLFCIILHKAGKSG